MNDQEWERICKRAAWIHGLAAAALIMVPFTIWIQAPELAARFDAWLTDMPDLVEAAIFCGWFVCFIGCFFPPRRVLGRGAWAVLGAGLIALVSWACATDVINDAFIIPALGEMGTNVVSAIYALLLCVCVAGTIFDGPKSWERRYSTSSGGGKE